MTAALHLSVVTTRAFIAAVRMAAALSEGPSRWLRSDLRADLIRRRQERGWGIRTMARKIGYSVSAMKNYENGDRIPTETLIREWEVALTKATKNPRSVVCSGGSLSLRRSAP